MSLATRAIRSGGIVAATHIAPFRAAAARVMVAALAPVVDDRRRLRRALSDAVEAEMLVSSPVTIIAVAVFGPAVALFLGPAWHPAIELFPWVAAATLLVSAHAAPLSALHVAGRFSESVAATVLGYVLMVTVLLSLQSLGIEAAGIAMMALWPTASRL